MLAIPVLFMFFFFVFCFNLDCVLELAAAEDITIRNRELGDCNQRGLKLTKDRGKDFLLCSAHM